MTAPDDLDWIPRAVRSIAYRVSGATIFVLAALARVVDGTASEVLDISAGGVGVLTAGLATAYTPRRDDADG